jgi:hypothetical protein
MGLGSIIFKEWRVTWTFSYTECDNNGSHDLTDFNIAKENNNSPFLKNNGEF